MEEVENGLRAVVATAIGKDKEIVDICISNLVNLGENYGGELLKVDVTIENKNNGRREAAAFAVKRIPPTETLQRDFNIQVTFKGEILFYKQIVPLLQNFQKENGINDVIDCFVKFYEGRINLNGSDVVDNDALIVMENLVSLGYRHVNRHVGYNLEESKILLKDLANLHSTVIALKLKKPNVFREELRPLCSNTLGQSKDDRFKKVILVIGDILLENKETAPYVPKVMAIFEKFGGKFDLYQAREPFATLSHCDLWVNNAMMLYVEEIPKKNIFLDFQLYSYRSPAIDLLNFLLTSVRNEIIAEEFDNLIVFYHSEFISNLQTLGCDTQPFSYSKFKEELALDAPNAMAWAILFIPLVVFGEKKPPSKKGEQIEQIDFESEIFLNTIQFNMKLACKERLFFMVETFAKKGWLKL